MYTVPVTSKKITVMGPDVRTIVSANTMIETEQLIEKQVAEINWSQAEDAINDQLPTGWYAKVED